MALSLAGVTGLVVSVGVTVDSYVVFFERLKDEVRAGRTLRTATERGFKRAFRTILAADVSSFIGAALLFVLTVGPVRGFAFFLGLSTLLDLVVAWFFTRPMVGFLASKASSPTRGWGRPGARHRPRSDHRAPPEPADVRREPSAAIALDPALPRRDELRLRRACWRSVMICGVIIAIGLLSLAARPQPGHRLRGRCGVGGAPGRRLGHRRPGGVRAPGSTGSRSRRSPPRASAAPGRGRAAGGRHRGGHAELAELTGSDVDEVNLNAVGPSWGGRSAEGPARAGVLPDRDHALHHAPLRVAHGGPHAGRADPRHPDHDRRLLDRRVRGDARPP